MNPITKVREELSKSQANEKRLQTLYSGLTKSHDDLIKSNVALENSFSAIKDGIENFCGQCSERAGALCSKCLLNEWLY